jgi:hypothetical protein
MATSYTSLLGLALPATGELSGTWGQTVNEYITQYLDAAIAGTQTISGSLTAVTLSPTQGAALVSAGASSTGSSQYSIINCTGNPASTLTVTINSATSKVYLVINATSTAQSVIVKPSGNPGITISSARAALIAWNGSDFVRVATNDLAAMSGVAATAATVSTTISSGAVATTQSPGTSNTTVATTAFVQAALQAFYPVGSIYTNATVSTNPSTLLGFGTWAAFGSGRVMIGDGGGFSAGSTGGSADAIVVSHTHTATVTDPGHVHTILPLASVGGGGQAANTTTTGLTPNTSTSSAVTGISVSNSTAGSSGTNANLQPYVVVYMWQRTA